MKFAILKVLKVDGSWLKVRCERWNDRAWYQPTGEDLEISMTLIPRGEPQAGARKHCVQYVADKHDDAEVIVDTVHTTREEMNKAFSEP